MNIVNDVKGSVIAILQECFADTALKHSDFKAISVELPREEGHGDLATNAAMVLTKVAGMPPRPLAEMIAGKLKALPDIATVDVAGPGFINITFSADFWQRQVAMILEEGVGFGNSTLGLGLKINVEYVSANPTGPMHIGHARGAVVGDALARLLLKAGFDVTKEYYINDAGAQVDVLTRSAYLRYREACGETIEIPQGLYPGEYLKPVGEGLRYEYKDSLLGKPEDEWLPLVKAYAVDAMMALIKNDLLDLGIEHDVFFSEQSLHDGGNVQAALQVLMEKGLIYQGMLEPPKGKTPDDWEPREQTLFKSGQFGDDCDRPLKKSDGSWTYFSSDVAYTRDKLERGFDQLIMVLGADHGGYVKRMEAVVQALGGSKTQIKLILSQLVKFLEGGEPVKMSKRSGTFTTVRDVIDAVGKDVIRFIMLTRQPSQPLDFDLVKVTEQSKDNPVFYVQYAHARCKSLLRLALGEAAEAVAASEHPSKAQLALLKSPEELALIRKLCFWPKLVESAAQAFEPHRVAYYLQDVAAQFHAFWNIGNDNSAFRFIQKDAMDVTVARLALARAVASVVASGLHVLGVEPAEEMR